MYVFCSPCIRMYVPAMLVTGVFVLVGGLLVLVCEERSRPALASSLSFEAFRCLSCVMGCAVCALEMFAQMIAIYQLGAPSVPSL